VADRQDDQHAHANWGPLGDDLVASISLFLETWSHAPAWQREDGRNPLAAVA
jgi:hypothetical protein